MASEDVSGGLLMQEDGTTGAGLGDNLIAEDEVGFDAVLAEDSTAKYSFYIINEDYSLATVDAMADNTWIEDAVTTALPGTTDPVLDFTEKNPFGDPTEST
jgi:hypothetical protein